MSSKVLPIDNRSCTEVTNQVTKMFFCMGCFTYQALSSRKVYRRKKHLFKRCTTCYEEAKAATRRIKAKLRSQNKTTPSA